MNNTASAKQHREITEKCSNARIMDFIFRYRAAWLSFIVCIFDLGAVAAVWLLAYVARFNGEGLPDLLRLGKAVLTGALLMIIGAALFQPAPAIPRSVWILTPLFLLLLMGG